MHLIHAVDSFKLLKEINRQAVKHSRELNCLLQVYIAQEETKFGFDDTELEILMKSDLKELANVRICGLMGMASFTNDQEKVRAEYRKLKMLFYKYAQMQTGNLKLETLLMGMSGDYKIAIDEGSTMVRVGSLIFGERSVKT